MLSSSFWLDTSSFWWENNSYFPIKHISYAIILITIHHCSFSIWIWFFLFIWMILNAWLEWFVCDFNQWPLFVRAYENSDAKFQELSSLMKDRFPIFLSSPILVSCYTFLYSVYMRLFFYFHLYGLYNKV